MQINYDRAMQKRANRLKRTKNPVMPTNLSDLQEKLLTSQGNDLLKYHKRSSEHLTSHLIQNQIEADGSTSYSLLFSDKEYISDVLTLVEPRTLEGFCDSTFRAVPQRVMKSAIKGHQLLVFQVVQGGHPTV